MKNVYWIIGLVIIAGIFFYMKMPQSIDKIYDTCLQKNIERNVPKIDQASSLSLCMAMKGYVPDTSKGNPKGCTADDDGVPSLGCYVKP